MFVMRDGLELQGTKRLGTSFVEVPWSVCGCLSPAHGLLGMDGDLRFSSTSMQARAREVMDFDSSFLENGPVIVTNE